MQSSKLKKAIIIAVILFLIGFFINVIIINNPDIFYPFFKYDEYMGGYLTDTSKANSLALTFRIIGYSLMGTSFIYSAIIFYVWLSEDEIAIS